jgi:A/G-specific adenine glycosylase
VKKSPFSRKLLAWYQRHKRDLPWRRTSDPYSILLSEVMLQQTQVRTVIPYYHRFLEAFPNFQTLAKAPLDRVLKLWEGLGYYSRARNLHALANAVIKLPSQKLPASYDEILELPGVGRYTAGAVLSIAFNQNYPVVDGNVQRVLARAYGIDDDVTLPGTQKRLWDLAGTLVPSGHAGDYNQAVMELGALICLPRNPLCLTCPVRSECTAYKEGRQNELPVKRKKAAGPHKQIGAGVIWHEGRILISQRPLAGLLGGLWEFPGGKQEPGETIEKTIAREILEELGVKVEVGEKVAEVKHAYSHFSITLHAHHCRYISGKPKALGVEAWKWVAPAELINYAFPAANQPVIRKLLTNREKLSDPASARRRP